MPKIEIYSTGICPYCTAAKSLLKQRGLEFSEIRIDQDATKRDEMMTRSNQQRSVPQIFINDQHVGGHDALVAADRSGKLAELLKDA